LRFGIHGLPLIGSCDWNDGMDKVGDQGKGESVWLAFFLYEVLMRFGDVAQARGDRVFAERCQTEAAQLRTNIEKNGWDGAWYRRAYFDDGTPLGSAANVECQIDSISQSWSVLSGAGELQRSRDAMDALDARLVRRDSGLVQLLTPPFDKAGPNPGYIRGYVPGVRENGGQYTHAAIWSAMAFAKLGDHERAWEVLRMINPISHGSSAQGIKVYKVEPYVVAADVYGVAPHVGRGGWTWYTGSSGWMYRLIVESLLGLTLLGDKLRITPCLPADWDGFTMHYRYRTTDYEIVVKQGAGAEDRVGVSVDGVAQVGESISLVDDQHPHTVEVWVRSVPAMR
jgi:cellobiose phosphorylase